jgi:hypothetical protein
MGLAPELGIPTGYPVSTPAAWPPALHEQVTVSSTSAQARAITRPFSPSSSERSGRSTPSRLTRISPRGHERTYAGGPGPRSSRRRALMPHWMTPTSFT